MYSTMDPTAMPKRPPAPPEMQLPPQAFTKTETGAVVTAMAFFDAITQYRITGNPNPFVSMFTPECVFCNDLNKAFKSTYDAGGYATAPPYTLENFKVVSRLEDAYRVTGSATSGGANVYYPKTGRVVITAPSDGEYSVDLQWNGERWAVYNFSKSESQ